MNSIDLDMFSKHRLALINELELGQIDKCQYIEATLAFYKDCQIDEPESIDNVDQGLYYYQYYNSLAKSEQIKYRELVKVDIFTAIEHRDNSSYYYGLKDNITKKILKLLKKEEVSAYYVKTNSRKLNQKLVEIVLVEREKTVLHTLNKKIIRYLDNRNLLLAGHKFSVIEQYINETYYEV